LTLAILFRSIYHISARSFYAQQDTKTPLFISFFTIGLNIVLAIFFTMVMGMGAYGLAWATAIVSMVEVMILFSIMSKKIEGLFDKDFLHGIGRMFLAAIITGFVSYFMVILLPFKATDVSFFSSFPKFVLIVSIGLISYVILSRIFKLQEVYPVVNRVKKILFGVIKKQ
jgi:putative peptidoglycan lipid II flippase